MGRSTTVTRCLTLQLLPPWLHWAATATSAGNTYSLGSLTLGSGIAARLLNVGASGA
jgi:hypothetical protein